MIKSTLLPRASHGAVPDEARFVGDPSRGITEGIINCDVRVSNQLLTIK
jgi:hypothetical protein